MQYVTSLAAGTDKEFRHLIWKHRNSPTTTGMTSIVRESRAELSATKSMWRDLKEGMADVAPLVRWAREHPDATLHAHSRCGIVAACFAARRLNNPRIVHFHFLARQWWLYELLRRAAGALPVYNSHLTCRHYRGIATPHTVQEPFINWPTSPHLGGKTGRRIVAAGALTPGKHPDVVLGAYERLKRRLPGLELQMYGASNRPLSPEFESTFLSRARHVPGVRVLPWQPDWLRQLESGDIFVHLGHPESFGMSMLETFARGLPLVVPPVSFFDDLAQPGRLLAGVERLPHLGVAAVTDALERLWSKSPTPQELFGLRMDWRERFSAPGAIDRMQALYRHLAGKPLTPES